MCCLVVFLFSWFGHYGQYISFWGVAEAAWTTPKVDLVAILVDNAIYGAIQWDLAWYTDTYIPKKAPGTKSLIIPIDVAWFYATDIQKILSNLYHEGEKWVPSQLVGVMLFGEVPMPVVDLDGKRFVSVYPYVDFEDPMFRYDVVSDVFVFNDHPESLPELWHSVFPTRDVAVFSKFFSKLKKYDAAPTKYAKPMIWYDDFPLMKSSYAEEERERYLNTLIFAESYKERQHVPVFSRLMNREYEEDTVAALKEAKQVIQWFQWPAKSDEGVAGDPKAEAAVDGVFQWLDTMLAQLDPKELEENPIEIGEKPTPTKLLEKEMSQEFQPNYSIFGNDYLSELQDNVLAWWRYQLEDVDTSLEKMEILDRVSKQFVTDMNLILEGALDSQVRKEKYSLKYPLPYRYSKRKPWYEKDVCGMLRDENNALVEVEYDAEFFKKVFKWINMSMFEWPLGSMFLQWDFMWLAIFGKLVSLSALVQRFGKEVYEFARYENHYFWRNAVDITGYQDLTIYRWTYFNELSIDALRDMEPTVREDELDDIPNRTWNKASIGASAWWFAQQVEQNRAYNLIDQTLDDKEIYDEMKCSEKQDLDKFSLAYWWGGSPLNIDSDKFAEDVKRPITKAATTNLSIAWNPSVDRQVGWPWYDPAGARLVITEVKKEQLHKTAHRDFGTVITLRTEPKLMRLMRALWWRYKSILDAKINWCEPRWPLDDYPGRSSFDEVDYFWVYENRFPQWQEWLWITVQPTIGAEEDLDDDRLPNQIDPDRDGDRVFDYADVNAWPIGKEWSPTAWWFDRDIMVEIPEEDEKEEQKKPWWPAAPKTSLSTPVAKKKAQTVDVSSWWNNGQVPGDVQPVWLSDESLPTNKDYKKALPSQKKVVAPGGVCIWAACPAGLCGWCVDGYCGDWGCDGSSCEAWTEWWCAGAGTCAGWSCGGGGWAGCAANGWWNTSSNSNSNNSTTPSSSTGGIATGNQNTAQNKNSSQWPQCTYPTPLALTPQQANLRFISPTQSTTLSNLFEKEYLVIDMSLAWCDDCIEFATQKNLDTDFQRRVGAESSCSFAVVTEDGSLGDWLNNVWWANTFVGKRSRENIGINGSYFALPEKFGAAPLTVTPTYYILNRAGQVVVSRQWALPDAFYELCVPNQCVAPPQASAKAASSMGQQQAAAWGGCGCSWGSPKKDPDEKEKSELDYTYEVDHNMRGRNIDGDRTANANDLDMDGDGLPNAVDPDVDDDGTINIHDPDIDNDCLPNGLDPDIDQDGLENRRDGDADADGVPDQRDDDIDADGIPNTKDEDVDADGVKDAEEVDSDKDGEPNSTDKSCGWCGGWCGGGGWWSCNGESRDVDGDQVLNEDDMDIDGDGVLNPFDSDMDGDGLLNEEDADIDGDWLTNDKDPDIDTDKLLNEQDDDRDSDGEINALDDTPNGFVPSYDTGVAQTLFAENCVGQDDDIDDDRLPNSEDYDLDGDGRGNREDPDMDSDGLMNFEDSDVDCDGKPNSEDDDTDGDGVPNHQEWDVDGDGMTNDIDSDVDGDGIPNGKDGDVDGDGFPNSVDVDIDGDQLPNHSDQDADGDGIPNNLDLDVDGDGLPNDMRLDENLNDGVGTPWTGNASCAANQANQSSAWWGSCSGTKSGWCGGWCGSGDPNNPYEAGWYDAANTDTDEDGTPDAQDSDIDNDGTANDQDSDVDGDGYDNDQDTWSTPDTDIDGDGISNDQDTDIDGDGVENEFDPDSDGDGIANENDQDADADWLASGWGKQANGGAWPDPTPNGRGGERDPVTWLYTDGLRSKREDRWTLCFLTGHDYRYQLIDSVVKHIAPEPEELDDMTLLTIERPVDDARYMAFHWLGGETVEFVYPDLRNVPIFDCDLLDPEDIEKNIRQYLKDKVQYYNQLLDVQLQKAPAHYGTHPAAFDFLATVDIAATPNRSYDLIPENYFIDVLGEKEIKRLSEFLYFLSLWRETRPQADTIKEFLEKSRERFNWNTKQKYVLQEFLMDDKNNEWEFDPIAYPTHIPQNYAYEVGYINSDGYDLIQKQVDVLEKEQSLPELPNYNVNTSPAWDITQPGAQVQTASTEAADAACGVAWNKAVPLPKRPKAFTCWLKKTIEKPIEFDLKVTVDMKEWYDWGKLSDPEGDDKNKSWWPMQDKLKNRWDQRSSLKLWLRLPDRLVPERSLTYNNLSLPSHESVIGGLWWRVLAQQNIRLAEEIVPVSDIRSQLFYDVEVGLSNQWWFFINEQTAEFLSLRSRTDLWPLRISITGTWDVCMLVEWKDVCLQSLQLTNSLYQEQLRLPVRVSWTAAWRWSLLITVCTTQGELFCSEKEVAYTLAPGNVDNLRILFPADKLIQWGVVPVWLRWYDAYKNPLYRVPDDFEVVLSGASFAPQEMLTTKKIAWLDEWYTLIHPATTDRVTVHITVPEWWTDTTAKKIIWSTSVEVVSGAWTVLDDQGNNLAYISYRLPHKDTGFFVFDEPTNEFVFRNNVPSFRLGVIEKWTVDHLVSPVEITPLQWLVRVWYVQQNEKNATRFVDENIFVTDGNSHLRVWVLPNGKAWRETLEITAPGLGTYYVNMDILPSGPDKMDMQLDQSTLAVGKESNLEITLKDSRWNLFTEETQVDLQLWWPISFLNTGNVQVASWNTQAAKITCRWGKATATCMWWSNWWWGGGGSCGGGGWCSLLSFSEPGSMSTSDTAPSWPNGADGAWSAWWNGNSDAWWTEWWAWWAWNNWAGSDWGTDAWWADWWTDSGDWSGGDWQKGEDGGSDDSSWGGWKVCEDTPPDEAATWLPPARYDRENTTFGEFQAIIPETLRPSAPEQDINVMYLNLYGYPWGNNSDTLQYLKNSKTLAVTTFWQWGAVFEPGEALAAMIHPNGAVKDLLGNMISEITVDWGTVLLHLWHQWGVGTITYGTHPEFDMLQAGEEYTWKPHKMVYTPNAPDSISAKSSFADGKIVYNDTVVVDMVRGYMDPHVHIRWSGSENDWRVTYENKQIGSLWIYRDATIPLEKTMLHPNYKYDTVPFGGSSSSAQAVGVYLKSTLAEWSSNTLFESIEASFDPRKNIWFRHNFKPITNFAQGMRMGPATQQFWWPFLINFGDPFLERVQESRPVKFTDYDSWPGQVIFSDTKSILNVDIGDINKDWLKDLIVAYKDGSIRVLKNYGGWQPYKDLGHIIVVADGLKEIFVWDVDGDGREDIMASTQSDKLRVYLNNKWEIAVDGTIVCLDIPNGDVNVAQVRQLFVDDMDGDSQLDIISNDINGDIKVFYGGGWTAGGNYLSTDPFQCDADRKTRQKQELVKSFATTLWWPIRDSSLRHRPELVIEQETTSDDPVDEDIPSSAKEPDVKKMNKKELKEYASNEMKKSIAETKAQADREKLLQRGIDELDARFEVPDVLRPLSERWKPWFAAVPANDPIFPKSPRFDVEKQFTDLNGGVLEKGDLVKVNVSLVPVGTAGPVIYRERLDGPWVIYKDEFNKIPSFDGGWLAAGAEIDRNIGQGYQFMISNLPLWWGASFSYEVQYNGNGYVNIQIETLQQEWFKWPANQSVAWGVGEVYAAWWWQKRIRAYPDDGCRKEYRLFSPGEQKIELDTFLDEKQKKYEDHFEETRADLEKKVQDPTTLDPLAKQLGISPSLKNEAIDAWLKQLGAQALGTLWWGDMHFTLDADSYLNYFVDEAEQKIEDNFKEWAKWLMKFATLWLFPDDYEFSYNKCQGFRFGKKMCGGGRPIPFNNDLLSPWAFHIFWCKPKAPVIPKIFPDFAWLPIFAFPTNGIIPVWPVNPVGAWGIFWGKTSQFRTYVTRTTANGMWLSLCFWPYDTLKLPTPLGDVAGNCIVIAGNIWGQCTAADETQPPENLTPKIISTHKDTEARTTLLPKQLDAYAIGSCDDKKNTSSPFVSPTNGNKPTNIQGNVTENQSLQAELRPDGRDGNRLDWYNDGGVTIENMFGGHGGDTFEVDYLKWGVGFQLKVEEGKIGGLVSCIFRKWKEKQIAYFANNALNMHVTIVLPTLEQISDGREQARHISDTDMYQSSRDTRSTLYNETQNSWKEGDFEPPETKKIRHFLPKSITAATTDVLNNPFDKVLQFFDQIPLISVEVRDVPLEVPLIYDEDFTKYAFHIQSWIDRNTKIIAEREKNDWIDANALQRMQQAMTNVKRNLNTLYQYKAMPGKIHALLHASDQYIVTIFQFVDTFISKLTGRLQDNAMRFSHWVDFIITLKGIIKTRQLLIDFTVNRQDRCSKCRQDHYDYYSCKLKLLCVDLPVIPIPSFHLPDIFIDLSNIQIGLDLIIPRFRFVPRRMDLFQLPDLPLPRWSRIDITIPTIPLLPPPPDLPELPELDLDLDMTLPVLPPAPKIPALSPAIKAVIKIMDVIGKFYCIFKWGIWLVREKFVKARVEQMTQRKQNIMPFDGIKIKLQTSPLQSYDYKVDATVDLKFDFRELYDLAQEVADDRNTSVNNSVKRVKGQTLNYFKPLIDDVKKLEDKAWLGLDPDINIDLTNPKSSLMLDEQVVNARGEEKPRILVWGPVKQVRDFLIDNASFVLSRQDLTVLHPQANELIQDLRVDPQVRPNVAGVMQAGKQAQDMLWPYSEELDRASDLVRTDWDGFLDSLATKRLLWADLPTQRFVTSLFDADRVFVDKLRAEPHPMESYLRMNEIFVDGFTNALAYHVPEELNMHQVQYDALANYLDTVKNTTTQARNVLAATKWTEQFGRKQMSFSAQIADWTNMPEIFSEPTSSDTMSDSYDLADNQDDHEILLAQATAWGGAGGQKSSLKVDFTQFIDGFFAPGKDWNYHDIIARQDKANTRYAKDSYEIGDVNGDGWLDVVNFDEHQIYIKYSKQQDSYGGGGYKGVTIWPFASYDELISRVEKTAWWYRAWWGQFKLWDEEEVSYEFSRQGHTYASMSFMWKNDPRMDGYVIMVTDEQQSSQDKTWWGATAGDPSRTRYVVLLPQPIPEEWLALQIPDLLPKQSLAALKKSWKVIDVLYYDGQSVTVEALLQNLERKRYYAMHAPLRLERVWVWGIAWLLGAEERVVKKVGTRSRQQVAGAQARGDDQLPGVDLELKRDLTGEIKARGPLMQGNINTTYTLKAKWHDNGKVIKNRMIQSWAVVKLADGDELEITNIDYAYPHEQQLLFVGMDQAGNIGQQEVRLNIVVPELKINEIRYLWVGAEVETEMSDTIDRGQIKFERNRFGLWKPLVPDSFPVKPTDPIVVGWLYPFDTRISIKDENGNEVATLDTKNGKISLNNWQQGNGANGWAWAGGGWWCSTSVSCWGDGKPRVAIVQQESIATWSTERVVMEISYVPEKLGSGWVKLLDTQTYQLRNLDAGYLWIYRDGWCVSVKWGECHIFISTAGDVLIPAPRNKLYKGEVVYEWDEVIYIFYDMRGRKVVRIPFISQSFQ